MNYMPEDSYHHPGQSPYTDQNPYSGMNGGPGSVHSSRISLHSNSSNRPRQVTYRRIPKFSDVRKLCCNLPNIPK